MVLSAEVPVSRGSETRGDGSVRIDPDARGNTVGMKTAVVVALTSKQRLAAAPRNVTLAAVVTGLPKDSVADVSQIVAH